MFLAIKFTYVNDSQSSKALTLNSTADKCSAVIIS